MSDGSTGSTDAPSTDPRRVRRRRAVVVIPLVVLLIAGIVTALLDRAEGTRTVSSSPELSTVAPGSSEGGNALRTELIGSYWSVATVAEGAAAEPLSVGPTDYLGLRFEEHGTAQLTYACTSSTVPWLTSNQTFTLAAVSLKGKACPRNGDAPSAATPHLAAAVKDLSAAQTVGHLDGRSLVLRTGTSVMVFAQVGTLPLSADQPVGDPVAHAAALWSHFPVTARPRPVVLAAQAVTRPTNRLPRGQDENAFLAGRVTLAVAVPSTPAKMDGYPILGGRDAVAQLADPSETSSKDSFVHITGLQLIRHPFGTDRGQISLPTWKLVLAETLEPVYVLAVAASGRFPATMADNPSIGGTAYLTADARSLSLPFEPTHVSTGGCDPDYTSTFASRETSTAVVLAIKFHFGPTAAGCGDDFYTAFSGSGPDQPGVKTLHLAAPLGNRVVVDQSGAPYFLSNW